MPKFEIRNPKEIRTPQSVLGWGSDEWFQVTRQRFGVPFDTPLLVWLGMVGGAGADIRPVVRHPEDEKQPSWVSGFGFRVSFGPRISDFVLSCHA